MERIELEGVVVRYGERTVLDGLDLGVDPGERVALVGPNGSGKTTLLRALAGILPVSSGAVRPAGALSRRDAARKIAFLPQDELWEFPFSVEDVVRCGRYALTSALYRESPEDRAAIDAALDAVGLGELRRRPVTELSGGERRRAVLARSLAQQAPVLLLDEPTTALDLEHKHAVFSTLARSEGTIVFSTHDLDAAAAWARRIVVLDKGRIAADGPPGDVLTEALLKEVFHVKAEIDRRDDGRIHVVPEI